MMDSDFWHLILNGGLSGLEYLIPLIVGFLTTWIFGGVKRFQGWVGKLPPSLQQTLVLVTAGILTWVASFLQVVLPTDISVIGSPEVSSALAAAFAMLIHETRKRLEKETP